MRGRQEANEHQPQSHLAAQGEGKRKGLSLFLTWVLGGRKSLPDDFIVRSQYSHGFFRLIV